MQHTVLTKTTEIAWTMLESYGIDPLPLFHEVRIDPAQMSNMTSRTNKNTVYALWKGIAERVNDPCFALKTGNFWHPSFMHALGYAWLSSSTLRSALNRLTRFIHIVNRDLEVVIEDHQHGVSVEVITPPDENSRGEYWYADADMSNLIAMCRANFGSQLNPLSVHFKRAQPKCAGEYYALFRCPVTFSADHNTMLLSREDVEKRLPGSNPLMTQIHDQEIIRYLARLDQNDIVQKVKNAIIELLPDGRMSDAKVANALFMSTRNLQRKLEAENTTFKTLLTEIRQDLALKYVQDSELTLTEISFMLGFSEMSAFSRAFKQWTGLSPRTQRQQLQGHQQH